MTQNSLRLLWLALGTMSMQAQPVPVKIVAATARSAMKQYPAALAIDGKICDASVWVRENSPGK